MGTSQSKQQRRESNIFSSSSIPLIHFKNYPLSFNHFNLVQCDAPPPPPPPSMDPNAPPPPPSASSSTPKSNTDVDQIAAAAAAATVPNPGPYEHAFMPCKAITSLNTQEGFSMDIQKPLSPYMLVMHNFLLGAALPDGRNKAYTFLTQFADENIVLVANFDPMRQAVTGRLIKPLLNGLITGKLQVSVSPDGSNDSLLAETDIGGMTWTGNLKYGSMGGGLVYGMNYYQSITQRLAMGGEGMYVAANGNIASSYTLKYDMPAKSGDDQSNDDPSSSDAISQAAANAGDPSSGDLSNKPSSWFLAQLNPSQGMLNLYYKRVVTPNRVTLGAELMVVPTLESQLTFGAEFKLQRSKISMAVDGTGKIQSVVESKLGMAPGSPTLSLNAEVDHAKDSMKFGYGLSVGS
mmetsp:Transcript_11388/g.13212  ORF Transcript_11388/g.13212 Transcript_11388/m.13212 type:complete len:406 (-) Transcript_11388:1130-2347(-)